MHKVYLVPGFFGFDQLGMMSYFRRTTNEMERVFAERGFDAEIIEVGTSPTSSIRRRAISLMHSVADTGGLDAESISFVGHSTGGLDARLLLSPGVQLVRSDLEEQIGERTRTVATLSTPHFGTPMAGFFTSMNGRYLLYVLSTLVCSQPGRVGAWMGARAVTQLASIGDRFGQRDTLIDTFANDLLRRITPQQSNELFTYLSAVAVDQGAMLQLTPEAIDLFNAAVLDRPGVDYVSFASAAPPPGAPPLPRASSRSAYESLTYPVFCLTHMLTARESRQYPYPSPARDLFDQIQAELPFTLSSRTNDGVVPTLSQVWGRLGGVYAGDHLDVVGQYTHDGPDGRYEGWLHSKAGFDDARFERLWSTIATDIVNGPTVDVRSEQLIRSNDLLAR